MHGNVTMEVLAWQQQTADKRQLLMRNVNSDLHDSFLDRQDIMSLAQIQEQGNHTEKGCVRHTWTLARQSAGASPI